MPRWLLPDVLVPVALALATTAWLAGPYRRGLRSLVPTSVTNLVTGDFAGSVWAYWWWHRATVRGQDPRFTDMLCAPAGEGLGGDYPNYVDAWMAVPFVELLGLPGGYNAFSFAVPALGALGAYVAARAFTPDRATALAASLVYGFSTYTFFELREGRPVTALVFLLPLVVGTWRRALAGSRVAALLAGVCAALLVRAYVPFAIALAPVAACMAVPSLVRRDRRRVAVLAIAIAACVGFAGSVSYAHELAVARPTGGATAAIWEPRLWRELLAAGRKLGDGVPTTDDMLVLVQQRSLEVTWPWRGDSGSPGTLSPWFWGAALALAPFGGARGLAWAAAAVAFVVLSWGPWAATHVGHGQVRLLRLEDARVIALPLNALFHAVPELAGRIRPARLVPVVSLCLLVAMVLGARGSRWRAGVAVAACALAFQHARGAGGLGLPAHPWRVPDFFRELRDRSPADTAIVELPAGLGHAAAPFQVVHERRRAEGVRDDLPGLTTGTPVRSGCFDTPFLRAVWRAGREDADLGAVDASALAEAVAQGFRYVVVYRAGYARLERDGVPVRLDRALAQLRARFGEPRHAEDGLVVFALTETATPSSRSGAGAR